MTRDGTRSALSPVGGAGARSGRRQRFGAVLLMLAVVLLLRGFVALPVQISSASMLPSLAEGDVVLTSRRTPGTAEIERGDLVVFADPRRGGRVIKRVVGLPGEDVVILDGVLHVDGRAQVEPWVVPGSTDGYYSRTFRVPDAHVLVLGDNRNNSVDSRDYGTIPVEDIEGRVLLRLWPRPGPPPTSG